MVVPFPMPVRYFAFDLLWLNRTDLRSEPTETQAETQPYHSNRSIHILKWITSDGQELAL
jgi:hypothetical protein